VKKLHLIKRRNVCWISVHHIKSFCFENAVGML